MYTIHQGINGGWYGSVATDDPAKAAAMAAKLATVLAELRSTKRPVIVKHAPKVSERLNAKGEAALAYFAEHPHAEHSEYTKAGHTLRTVKWLQASGHLKLTDNTWHKGTP